MRSQIPPDKTPCLSYSYGGQSEEYPVWTLTLLAPRGWLLNCYALGVERKLFEGELDVVETRALGYLRRLAQQYAEDLGC